MADTSNILRGVVSAAPTPLTADMAPDHAALHAHCRWALANGSDAVLILGSTGEGNSFSIDERLEITERVGAAGLAADRLLISTGNCAAPDAVKQTRAALDAGIANVLIAPPFYYKGYSDEGLAAAYSEVIDRVGDSRLRLYLYHYPMMSGVPVTHGIIERLAKRYADTLVGYKDSSFDMDHMVGVKTNFPHLAVLGAPDEIMLPLLRRGGDGVITATANVTCPIARVVHANWRDGAIDAAQEQLVTVRAALAQFPLIPAVKEVIGRNTGNPAWSRVRPPFVPLTEGQRKKLFADLDATGFALPEAA